MKIILNLHRIVMAKHVFLILCFLSSLAIAQSKATSSKNKNPFPVKYTSEADQKISLHTITLAPVYDNVNRIYAEPIQKLLIDLLQSDKVWGYSEFPDLNKKIFVETYDNNPAEVLDILTKTNTQGLLTAIITKGPSGLTAKLRLFTADQGILLAEESFQDLNTFEIQKLREEITKLYLNLKNKLPYRGIVLSRRGLDVTLNAGEKNGLTTGQEVTLAQILKINRHPKLKYMVSAEKEIIGKLQITKVEPYLSFAQIIFEKETGVIDVGAKLLPTEFISYPMPIINAEGHVTGDKQAPALVAVKAEQKEIEVANEPKSFQQLGKAILQGSLSQFSESGTLNSGASASASQSMAMGLSLGLELWLTPNWFVNFDLSQSIFKTDNSLNGSSPSELNYTYAKYNGSIGYYFLINKVFTGPKIGAQLGYTSIKTDVTDTFPRAFTSKITSGLLLKISGVFPLQDYPMDLGASYDIFLSPKTTETPTSSGSDSTRINSFGFYASYHVSPTLNYRVDLNFNQIQTDFTGGSGSSTQSSTVKTTTELFGIEYLF
ncbi:MAG: hypothetical protein WA160_05275 [Pseudobdellovibrio sp.]